MRLLGVKVSQLKSLEEIKREPSLNTFFGGKISQEQYMSQTLKLLEKAKTDALTKPNIIVEPEQVRGRRRATTKSIDCKSSGSK